MKISYYMLQLVVSTAICACKQDCSVQNQLITDCRDKYWDIVYDDSTWGNHGTYKFSSDGKCVYLKYDASKNRYWVWKDGDYFQQNFTWCIVDNSVIVIQGYKYDLIKLTKRFLVIKLKHEGIKDITVLMPSELNTKYE